MRRLLTYLFSLVSLTAYSQLPEISRRDFTGQDQIIYNTFVGKCDFMIAYTTESYWWANKFNYSILVLNKSKWERLNLSYRKKNNGTFSKPVIAKATYDTDLANKLIQDLSILSFWNLNTDSLNIRQKRLNDSTELTYSFSDGVNYKFEILKGNNYMIIDAYEPEFFLKKIPEIKEREKFIKARQAFEIALKNNGT